MSKYEWERGSIVIPTAQWSTFRKGLIAAWNTEQERLFSLAQRTLERVKAQGKGKRGFDYANAIREAVRSLTTESRDWNSDEGEVCRLLGMIGRSVEGNWVRPTKPTSPKRKDLKILPTSRGASLDFDEARLTLDDKTRTAHWHVSENNHACDTAREHPMGRAFFSALAKVEWTRGSGGKIVGNDEYNRDADDEGEGGNYVTATFGPKTAAEKKAEAARRSTFGGGRRW